MGVDCNITLSHRSRVRDVGSVIGKLAGLPSTRWQLGGGGWSCHVPGVEVSAIPSMEGLADIRFQAAPGETLVDGQLAHHVLYHFEGDKGRGLLPPSTPFWCAVAKRLVEFFGGSVDYNDCDDSEVDHEAPEPSEYDIHAEDDEPWHLLQQAIERVEVLTSEEIEEARKVASYNDA